VGLQGHPQLTATCFADRLSCCDFWPNQFRLLPSAAPYWLLHMLRGWLERARIGPMRWETLRLTVVKVSGRAYQYASYPSVPRRQPPD